MNYPQETIIAEVDRLRAENAQLRAQREQWCMEQLEKLRDHMQLEINQLKARAEQAVCSICKNPGSDNMLLVHEQCGQFSNDIGEVLLKEARQERDQAQAALREWKLEFLSINQALSDREYTHKRVAELELKNFHCGKHHINSDELTQTIELLEKHAGLHDNLLHDEITRLKALQEKAR